MRNFILALPLLAAACGGTANTTQATASGLDLAETTLTGLNDGAAVYLKVVCPLGNTAPCTSASAAAVVKLDAKANADFVQVKAGVMTLAQLQADLSALAAALPAQSSAQPQTLAGAHT